MGLPASEAPESLDNNELHVEVTKPRLGWCSIADGGFARALEERGRERAHHSRQHLQHLHLAT